MRRKLFTAASVLSLLLCVATVVLWVGSSATETIHLRCSARYELSALSVDWGTSLSVTRSTYFSTPQFIEWPDYKGIDPRRAAWLAARATKVGHFSGFRVEVSHDLDSESMANYTSEIDRGISKTLVIPAWFLLITTETLPTLWVTSRRGSLGSGHCRTCHYDLTGNTSGVCPECGTVVAGKV